MHVRDCARSRKFVRAYRAFAQHKRDVRIGSATILFPDVSHGSEMRGTRGIFDECVNVAPTRDEKRKEREREREKDQNSFIIHDESACRNDARIKKFCIAFSHARKRKKNDDERTYLSQHDNNARNKDKRKRERERERERKSTETIVHDTRACITTALLLFE